jgi:two-component system, OmpR family, sensor kinase
MSTFARSASGAGRAARRLSGRTSLRVKLIAAVLALVTAALAGISIVGFLFLRGYLLGQADSELAALVNGRTLPNINSAASQYVFNGPQVCQRAGFSVEWLPATGKARQVGCEVQVVHYGERPVILPGPAVRNGDSWLSASSTSLSEPVTVSALSGGGRWRVTSVRAELTSPPPFEKNVRGTIVVGVDVTDQYRTLGELTTIDVIISVVLLLIIAILGIAVIRTSLRPLTDIEQTAQAIAAGDLGRRVPERDPRTEVGRLGRSLNMMLAQIESAFRARTESEEAALRSEETARQSEEAARSAAFAASRSEGRMRQFVADASHELRTPLTAIRGYAEYYRQRGGVEGSTGQELASDAGQLTYSDLDRIIQRVEQEATRMGVLVDDMLLLARLDQRRPMDFRTVDLLAIAADALHDARVIAPGRTINLTVGTPDAPLVVGDEVSLRQVVGNLMSNAMLHTPDGSPIDITIRAGTLANGHQPAEPEAEPAVILEVTDQGPGLSDEQKEHVFERFYRTDRARSRTAGGTGLGLAIVAAQVSAHHGRVWVDSEPGHGATFGFALPLAPEARQAD